MPRRKGIKRKRSHLVPPLQNGTPSELPPCAGPKLKAFNNGQTPIQCLERLDTNPPGSQSCVYKVKIDSRIYALKIFKYFDPVPIYTTLELFNEGPPLDFDLVRWHTDPFFAECRAYGRIQEIEAQGKGPSKQIAAHCYGFIESSEQDQRLNILVQSQQLDLGYPQNASRRETDTHPLRAIVKEFVEGDSGVPRTRFGVKTLLGRVKALNKMGIYNGDIRSANIKNGLLLDFGLARTDSGSILNNILPERQMNGMKYKDLVNFDEMVEGEGIQTTIRAYPMRNTQYCKKLRLRKT